MTREKKVIATFEYLTTTIMKRYVRDDYLRYVCPHATMTSGAEMQSRVDRNIKFQLSTLAFLYVAQIVAQHAPLIRSQSEHTCGG